MKKKKFNKKIKSNKKGEINSGFERKVRKWCL